MSEVLTDNAPAAESAVTSVEETAPDTSGAVVEGSAPQEGTPEGFVPAARFNGLMGKFHQTQQALEATRAELESLRTQPSEEIQPVADNDAVSALQAQVAQLTEMLTNERLESTRAKVLDEFPEAKPFADLIVADSPDELREMARLIAERAKSAGLGQAPAAEGGEEATTTETTEAAPTEEAPEAPVTGGGSTISGAHSVQERVTEAINAGDFSAYLAAKFEAAEHGVGVLEDA